MTPEQKGWIKLHRPTFEHHLFKDDVYSRREAWLWMISQASFEPEKIDIMGRTVAVGRGKLCHSIRYMAEKWLWKRSTVERFLSRLKTESMIETDSSNGVLLITICNYDKYQASAKDELTVSRDSDRDRSGTAAGQQRDNIEEKNLRTKEYTPLSPPQVGEQASLPIVDDRLEKQKPPQPAARGTRFTRHPDGIPDDWGQWAITNSDFSEDRIISIYEEFADYWAAKTGKDATKLDWFATWRNKIRREVEWSRQRPTASVKIPKVSNGI